MNKEAGLSPGKFTEVYAKKQLKRRQIHEASSKLPSTKRRRLQLKEERSNIRCANEVLEGDTYASGIRQVLKKRRNVNKMKPMFSDSDMLCYQNYN